MELNGLVGTELVDRALGMATGRRLADQDQESIIEHLRIEARVLQVFAAA